MSVWIIILLGIVQGLTEFLPVSSSGHLVILEKYFDLNVNTTLLNVVLHFGTLLAVCIYYRKKIWQLIKHPLSYQTLNLILATLPAVIFVLLFNTFVNTNMNNTIFIGLGFIITAILLIVAETICRRTYNFASINQKSSLLMGVAQALAIFPGLSRSGTTLAFGLLSGVNKEEALDFSFLMSIPIIFGSLIYELFGTPSFDLINNEEILFLIIGFFVAFVTALLGINLMQKIVKKMKLWYFVPYLLILGILVIVL